MASIHKEILVNADPDDVWDALRDWGALHERLAPGFVTGTELDGSDRIVTFFNGAVAREVLVDRDDERRRLVWSVVDGPFTHHNGCAQVHEEPDGRTRFVWVADLLPDAAAAATAEMMERGIEAVRRALERSAAASA
jgi:carbon monoxide dehydrogenase subunit G